MLVSEENKLKSSIGRKMIEFYRTIYFNYSVNKELEKKFALYGSSKEWKYSLSKHRNSYKELRNQHLLNDSTLRGGTLTDLYERKIGFWVTVLNLDPHSKPDHYLVDLTIMYMNVPISFYVERTEYERLALLGENIRSN